MRDKRTPKDVCGEATLTEQLMKVLLYVPSPRLLFSQSRNMLSVSVIKLPLSFPYHPSPPRLALALSLPSLFACHSRVT